MIYAFYDLLKIFPQSDLDFVQPKLLKLQYL